MLKIIFEGNLDEAQIIIKNDKGTFIVFDTEYDEMKYSIFDYILKILQNSNVKKDKKLNYNGFGIFQEETGLSNDYFGGEEDVVEEYYREMCNSCKNIEELLEENDYQFELIEKLN